MLVFSVAILLCLLVLSLIVRRNQIERRYPAFSAFVYFELLSLAASYFLPKSAIYFWFYYASWLVGYVLIAAVGREIYGYVFGPDEALPDGVPLKFKLLITMAVTSSIVLALVLKATRGGIITRRLVTMEQAALTALWLAFLVLLAYSGIWRIRWPVKIARIAHGFVLFLTVNVIGVFMRGSWPEGWAKAAQIAGPASFALALVWWLWALRRREAEPVEATQEQVNEMAAQHRATMALLEQFRFPRGVVRR